VTNEPQSNGYTNKTQIFNNIQAPGTGSNNPRLARCRHHGIAAGCGDIEARKPRAKGPEHIGLRQMLPGNDFS